MMFDWKNSQFSTPPTVDNIEKYPTMLDILDSILLDFSMNTIGNEAFFLGNMHKGLYHACAIKERSNIVVLNPQGLTTNMRFRGQQHYYQTCLSSYDRLADERKQLLAQLHFAEFETLLYTHPVINFFGCSYVKVESVGNVWFHVDFEGLAQHYGIPTRVFDFSNDLSTAAFFAVTSYDSKTESYTPYIPNENVKLEDKYGVLYYYDVMIPNLDTNSRPLGMSFFNRPGAQSGYAYTLNDNKDLNLEPRVKKLFFKHDGYVSKMIYNNLAKGKLLFPTDSLCGKAKEICRFEKCSKMAFDLWTRRTSSEKSPEELKEMLERFQIEIVDVPWVSFSEEEKIKDWNNWNSGGKEHFLQKINFIPIFYV